MKSFQTIALSIALLVISTKPAQSGIFNESTGARSASLGYSCITLTDIWSAINNPAGLAFCEKFAVGLSTENKFLLEELSTNSLVAVLPFSTGSFGFSFSRFGEAAFNETSIGISYGMQLSSKISAGIRIFHYAINQNNELGSAGIFSFQGGITFKQGDDFAIAFHFFNPGFSTRPENKPELSEIFKLGISFHLSEALLSYLEAQNNKQFGNGINTGIEYLHSKNLSFRIGYSSSSEKFTFGMGLKIKSLLIDIGSSMHQTLGYSPQLSLSYEF